MTTLHPAAVYVLQMPGWKVRLWLAVVITLVMASMPSPVAGLILWVVAWPYMWMTETLACIVGEKHRVLREAIEERDQYAPQLAERDARITALEADLATARATLMSRPETADEVLYRQVGLHPRAPEFLVLAARRAYRGALHPDRHPRHREQAHRKFVQAEAAFNRIAADRRC